MQEDKFKNTNTSAAYEGGMKALSKSLQTAFVILLLVILFMLVRFISFGGYFAVKAQEAVIVLQFGKYKEVYTRDWHWFLPYPVNRFIHIKTSPEYMTVDFSSREAHLMPGAPVPPLEIGRDQYMLSGDGNILHSNWKIGYRVNDPRKFYENVLSSGDVSAEDENITEGDVKLGLRGPRTMLKNLFRRAVIQTSASYKVGDIYDTKRSIYADAVKSLFIRLVNESELGIVVDDVVLNSVTPPTKTAAAFNEVASAMNRKAALKNQAEEYSMTVLNEAAKLRSAILADAEAYRISVVSSIKSESIYFQSIAKEYLASPRTVLMTLYNNTLSEVLSAQEGKYILGTSAPAKEVRLKLNPEAPKRKKPQAEAK